eukprot:scaffold114_cov200-Alexandrium_tamarense.AAC.89
MEYPSNWLVMGMKDIMFFKSGEGCCISYFGFGSLEGCRVVDVCSKGDENDGGQETDASTPTMKPTKPVNTSRPTRSFLQTASPTVSPEDVTSSHSPSEMSNGPNESKENCETFNWHVATKPGMTNTCTNSGDHPQDWLREEFASKFLFLSSDECCSVMFPKSCVVVSVCEGDEENEELVPPSNIGSDCGALWHVTTEVVEGKFNVCTNGKTAWSVIDVDLPPIANVFLAFDRLPDDVYPPDWDLPNLAPMFFFEDPEQCCKKYFASSIGDDCELVDVCEASLLDDEPEDKQTSVLIQSPVDYPVTDSPVSIEIDTNAPTQTPSTSSPTANPIVLVKEDQYVDYKNGSDGFEGNGDIPWMIGGMWEIDDSVARSGSHSIRNIIQEGSPTAPAISDLTLKLKVDQWAKLKCYAKIAVSMPFDSLKIRVNDETIDAYYVSTSSSWLEIVVGLTPGQQKVTFRVEKAAFEPPFARTSQFGSDALAEKAFCHGGSNVDLGALS